MPILPDKSARHLQAATSPPRVEELLAALPTQLWPHTLVIVKPSLRAHVRRLIAQLGTPARLPNELLLEIFRLLSLWDRVRAAIVCRRWRAVSLNAVSALWTDIPYLRNQDTYRHLLVRSGDSPIALQCKPTDSSSVVWFCDLIFRNLHRIKALRLSLPYLGYDDTAAIERLKRILGGQAPMLESLSISRHGRLLSSTLSAFSILSSSNLRTIELDIVPLAYLQSCSLAPGPRRLKLSPDNTIEQPEWSILSALPALEVLALELRYISRIDIPPHSSPLPSSLQELYLELRPDCFDVLVTLDDLSRLQTLCVTFLGGRPELRRLVDLLPFLRDETTSSSVYDHVPDSSLMAADARGRKRILQNITFGDDWHMFLSKITRLWLSMSPLDPAAPSAVLFQFPVLEEFTVDTTPPSTCDARRRYLLSGIGHPHLPAWPKIASPRLRVVRFASGERQSDFPAGTALGYLARLVTRPLERLVFDRAELAPTVGVDSSAAALRAFAEEVEMVHSKTLAPELHWCWFTQWARIPGF